MTLAVAEVNKTDSDQLMVYMSSAQDTTGMILENIANIVVDWEIHFSVNLMLGSSPKTEFEELQN